jgi:ketosteroid isomerase-like protein
MMPHVKAVLTIVIALMSVYTGLAQSKNPAEKTDPEFKALITDYYKAWTVHEGQGAEVPEYASKFYAKDVDLIFFDIAPMKYNGWEEYKKGVMSNLIDQMASTTFTPNDDLKVTRRGNIAWTTVTFRATAKMKKGGDMALEGRDTKIWEKRGDKWLIVHEHLSVPLPE